ncbi:phosphotransferase [Aminipila butyrica]|uniref:Phosphotransferase n=1 Tax=Aminipila butyrica TaxID=433296 RepID=A0A858BVT0_9FIRM|nr:phosphotransferase [Aminipila butyrica]QIB69175.1 phosphotransferase [Aminipila butyrica]
MVILTEYNIVDYLKDHTNLLEGAQQITSRYFDSGTSESGSGDGYINFVFCVDYALGGEQKSLVIKQARPYSKLIPIEVPTCRNKTEYEATRLKRAVVAEYLPELYLMDQENNVFVMESLTQWKILRYQFNKMEKQPGLSRKIAEYLAVSNFFTSEIYLDTSIFRQLECTFVNGDMRRVIEAGIFIPEFTPLGEKGENAELNSDLYALSRNIWENHDLIAQCYLMRDIYMRKSECLIHGDFHTSNIFIRGEEMKVIDMEYAFVGPYSYDLGYLLNNYISQYAACAFKSPENLNQAASFQQYLLESVREIYIAYVEIFDSLWDQFGKETYSHSREYRGAIYRNILQEMLGFAAAANISRITMLTEFPDFDVIRDRGKHLHAKRLSLIISQQLLLNRTSYEHIDEVVQDITRITSIYKSNI